MMFFSAFLRQLASRVLAPEKHLKHSYQAFRRLLEWDQRSHELLTALEKFYYDKQTGDFHAVIGTYDELYRSVSEMIEHLDAMAPRSYKKLFPILHRIDLAVRTSGLSLPEADTSPPFVMLLEELPSPAESLAGGKAAHLSKMLVHLHLPVPKGFVITSRAFHTLCEANHLQKPIETSLAGVDADSPSSLEATSGYLTSLILEASLPAGLDKAIRNACAQLSDQGESSHGSEFKRWALRSSASGEDAALSFAGQYKTVLNVRPEGLNHAYKEVIASKYSPNALFYRIKNGLLDQETPMAVLVLEMIDAAASGIVYSRSPLLSGPPVAAVYSVWGLGELLVKGATVPDIIELSREDDQPKVTRTQRGTREMKLVLSPRGDLEPKSLEVHEKEEMSLTENDAVRLAKWAQQLESHFGSPQDIEWCKDHEAIFTSCNPALCEPNPKLNLLADPTHPRSQIRFFYSAARWQLRGLAAGGLFS